MRVPLTRITYISINFNSTKSIKQNIKIDGRWYYSNGREAMSHEIKITEFDRLWYSSLGIVDSTHNGNIEMRRSHYKLLDNKVKVKVSYRTQNVLYKLKQFYMKNQYQKKIAVLKSNILRYLWQKSHYNISNMPK